MGKGLGIAVLIVAALAIIIPVYGIYLGLITALLGIAVAALKEPAFAVAIGVLNILDAVFLTPSLKLASTGAQLAGRGSDANTFNAIFWLWVGAGVASVVVAVVIDKAKKAEPAAAGALGH